MESRPVRHLLPTCRPPGIDPTYAVYDWRRQRFRRKQTLGAGGQNISFITLVNPTCDIFRKKKNIHVTSKGRLIWNMYTHTHRYTHNRCVDLRTRTHWQPIDRRVGDDVWSSSWLDPEYATSTGRYPGRKRFVLWAFRGSPLWRESPLRCYGWPTRSTVLGVATR